MSRHKWVAIDTRAFTDHEASVTFECDCSALLLVTYDWIGGEKKTTVKIQPAGCGPDSASQLTSAEAAPYIEELKL
jgi:hypothetical protein